MTTEAQSHPSVTHGEDALIAADGVRLFVAHWLPAERRALVVLVHGYGEHSGRYAHVIAALTAAGYGVYTIDHRGHGRSEGLRAYIDTLDRPVADLKQYITNIRAAHPGERLFLYGHSMGALIALGCALAHQEDIDGLITSGAPVLADANVPGWLLTVARGIAAVAPTLPLANLVPVERLSHDPAVIAAFRADPLTYKGKLRAGMGMAINDKAAWVRQRLPELRVPYLILHGAADVNVSPAGSTYAYEHAGSADKMLKLYEGLYHEIHNEPERGAVLADILNWLNERAAPPA